MRIRKHAKISPLVYVATSQKPGAVVQSHVCQLNQSPWDVMIFDPQSPSDPSTPPSPPPPPPPQYQVDRDESYIGNGTFSNYIGAHKSAASVKFDVDEVEEKPNNIDDIGIITSPAARRFVNGIGEVKKNDDDEERKRWQCKRRSSEQHTSQLKSDGFSYKNSNYLDNKSYNNPNFNRIITKNIAKNIPEKSWSEVRRRARPKKPISANFSTNPYEFYYYSGFGPRWGKKRGPTTEPYANGDNGSDTCKNNGQPNTPEPNGAFATLAVPVSSQSDDENFDYVEDEEEDYSDDDEKLGEINSKKKRARKPVKARSLKSLM